MQIELSAPQHSFIATQSERNLLHCGQGFGKTHAEGIIPALFVQHCPKAIGLIGANTYSQLSDATLFRIFQVWNDYFGWKEYTQGTPEGVYVIDKNPPSHFTPHGYTFKSNANKIFFKNGAVIMTVSLDNYMALDGREVSWAILDETKDTNEVAVKEVILARLRYPGVCKIKDFDKTKELFGFCAPEDIRAGEQSNPLFIATSPSKEQWLAEMFHLDKYRDDIERTIFDPNDYFHKVTEFYNMVIASAFWNKKNLPNGYIEMKLQELTKDRSEMLVYGSPFGKLGVEYYAKFDRHLHVKPCTFTPNYPIHISFDFNVNPYMTLVVKQIIPQVDSHRVTVKIFREFCLESPNNSIEAICRAFDDEYGHLCKAGLFFYGDASGKNTLPIEEARSLYKVVEKCLYHLLSPTSKRLLKKNINHKGGAKGTIGRRDFMNKIFSGGYPVDVEIDPKCKKTILDFEQCKEDANGAKEKKKEKINGVMAEKYGHTSDACDGFFCYLYYPG
jgi:hypothetical protein